MGFLIVGVGELVEEMQLAVRCMTITVPLEVLAQDSDLA